MTTKSLVFCTPQIRRYKQGHVGHPGDGWPLTAGLSVCCWCLEAPYSMVYESSQEAGVTIDSVAHFRNPQLPSLLALTGRSLVTRGLFPSPSRVARRSCRCVVMSTKSASISVSITPWHCHCHLSLTAPQEVRWNHSVIYDNNSTVETK